jgi:cytochrome P450
LIDADPFPYYAELREKHPCYWSEGAELWILSRYDDIVEAARDWQTFSSAQGNMIDELPGRAGATLGTTDPPRHDRLRALSQAAFLRRNLDRMVAPTLEIADRSLARIAGNGRSSSSTTFPARSPSACCSAPWACPSAITPKSGAR